ncbi:MAG: DUF3373 domain-containing protein [Desulfuromonadales bacterium]|nr:DUF3373 domain-containing protein [Desulfuromonadales bacterium]MDW7756574.1 DUF3373 domain-containing protein [Desulfuromonadales bacterium]
MRKLMAILLAALLVAPATALAATSIEELQKKIEELTDEVDYLSGRVDKTEKHTALDRIEFSGDMRAKADTLHYSDVAWNPGVAVDMAQFGADAMGGVFGDPTDPTSLLGSFMGENPNLAAAFMAGQLPPVGYLSMLGYDLGVKPPKGDLDNDVLYTTRLRLNMKAKVYDNVNFAGRLAMYKNWGDSTGVKVFDSWDSFTMDGTNGGNTTGDWLRVERAYFDWSHIGGSNFYLSIGRRPSTYGPPSQYRENELRGGTPSGHLVHFNFDGITIGYNLSELTGIEGQTIRFCYGQGFESQYGNGELFTRNDFATDDTHLGGINFDILNDGTNFLQLTAFAALDVVDGFKGTFAFPAQMVELFAPTINQDASQFPNMNFMVRYQPSTVIGDMFLGGLGYAREEMNDVKYFASLGWTRLESNGDAGMFGGMGSDNLYVAAPVDTDGDGTSDSIMPMPTNKVVDDSARDGYGVYAGVQVPAPLGKFGLEYNYGSKYWSPFTQAQDDIIGSKLATRGHAGEAYYIFDINPNMFIKVGGIYYDYEYTGSGSPVGKPQKVDDVLNGTAFSMLPVVDKAWDGYASLTVKF